MKKNTGYKIWTNDGWKDFDGIQKSESEQLYHFTFDDGSELECTADHLIFYDEMYCKKAIDYSIGEEVYCFSGSKKIKSITVEKQKTTVYDILEVGDENKFFANDVLVHNCEFIGKTGTLLDSTILKELLNSTKNKSYEYIVDNNIRFYKQLDITKKYLIALDPSMGNGGDGDYAAIEVFEFPTFIQVAEFMSNSINQNDQVEKLKTLVEWMYKNLKDKGCRSPEIYWSLENNSLGEGFLCALKEKSFIKGYNKPQDYIKRANVITEIGNKRLGFTTTKRSKAAACSQLKTLLETRKMTLNSNEIIQQLSNYTMKEVSYSGEGTGVHDDLISATLIIIRMYMQCKNNLDLMIDNYGNNRTVSTFISLDSMEMPFLYENR